MKMDLYAPTTAVHGRGGGRRLAPIQLASSRVASARLDSSDGPNGLGEVATRAENGPRCHEDRSPYSKNVLKENFGRYEAVTVCQNLCRVVRR